MSSGKDLDMGTNGTEITEARLRDEMLRVQTLDKAAVRKRDVDHRVDDMRAAGEVDLGQNAEGFALAPLVDKIAYSIARGLVVAVKELEDHIAAETRKVGDAVDRRLDTLQTSLQDVSRFMGDQRTTNGEVQNHLQQLKVSLQETDARYAAESAALREADTRQTSQLESFQAETKSFSTSLSERIDINLTAQREADARQTAELGALQKETRAISQSMAERIDGICADFGIQQEDIAAIKATLGSFSSRVDALVERLDRQAEAVRSMCSAYSQRETELEQLVDGLARLRAYPTPMPANQL
jgi:chromosome segregation ATPase